MKHRILFVVVIVTSLLVVFGNGVVLAGENMSDGTTATLLVEGLEGAAGSTVGPDGALYVTEAAAGRIARIDPETGESTVFADGLPQQLIPVGGVMDVAFLDDTAYALVTMVGEDLGGSDVVGLYRIDAEDEFSVVADIGTFSVENMPTNTEIEVPSGVQYAMEVQDGGFLVTDGHHNRVLRVELDGTVTELITFDNIVPTGMALSGDTVYMAEAGPVPHIPDHGKVISFGLESPEATDVASGARLIVDVELGPDGEVYALAQGEWAGEAAGEPAEPNTGSLVMANEDGTFTMLAEGLDRPTSFELIGSTAYVVSRAGGVWTVDLSAKCSLATLKGTYVFRGQGFVAEGGELMPFAEAGMFMPDGEGHGTGIISLSVNGEAIMRAGHIEATYEMTGDCVYAASDETGMVVDMYVTPSGDTISYFTPGVSGTMHRR